LGATTPKERTEAGRRPAFRFEDHAERWEEMMATRATNGAGEASGRNPFRNRRWHDDYPEVGTGPIAVEPYISTEFFARERELVFQRSWLNVGRVEQIPGPGDFIVKDIAVCGTSIVVARDKSGAINAFHNVCSHRLNKLVWEDKGTCNGFKCRFHGWAYKLDGKLTGVPGEAGFFDLDKKALGLKPVSVDVWQGFIFINLDTAPTQTLTEYLGEWGERLSAYPFTEYSAVAHQWRMELNCNWKLVKDAFKEAYHVPFIHKTSLRDSFSGAKNPLGHLLHVELYPLHHRASAARSMDYRPRPVEGLAFQYGGFLMPDNSSEYRPVPGTNPSGREEWLIDVNGIFPNMMLDPQQNSYFTYHMWPLAVDRTLWEVTAYFPEPQNAAQRFSQEYGRVIFRDVILEDGSTLEKTQSVLASGARTHFLFQDEELMLRHDNNVLHSVMAVGGDTAKADGRRETPYVA
jgi:phenylpropionate dioxygenase-like ring-hydroxylating dioxygenase large terminal subunit